MREFPTLDGLIERLPCGVAVLDFYDGMREVYANPAWVTGRSAQRLPQPWLADVHPEQPSSEPGWEVFQIGPSPGHALVVETAAVAPEADQARLTARELQVALLISHGNTNSEIGAELFLSRATVATHVARILFKLKFRSRVQVAAWAAGLRQGGL